MDATPTPLCSRTKPPRVQGSCIRYVHSQQNGHSHKQRCFNATARQTSRQEYWGKEIVKKMNYWVLLYNAMYSHVTPPPQHSHTYLSHSQNTVWGKKSARSDYKSTRGY